MKNGKRILVALSAFAIVAGAVAKSSSSSLTSGLVLWFRSGPSTSAKIKDVSRNQNIGRPTSLVVSNSPSLVSMQDTHQLTLALWIKPNSIPYEFPDLISKGGYGTGGYELTLNANGDNDIVFFSGYFLVTTEGANGSLVNNHLGEWIHIVYTMDTDAQTAQFYVDGQPFANSIVQSGSITNVNFNLTNDLYIGGPDPSANANRSRFDGDMQNVMIFNRALSADEVQKLFSTTKPKGFTAPASN